MAETDHAKLYQTQISQTEWFAAIGHEATAEFRAEDNEKRERLARLNQLFGLPFDRPHQFSARQVVDRTPEFLKFLETNGNELCACRVIPLDPKLPKLRTRGHTIKASLDWLQDQTFDPDQYRIDFVPHPPRLTWATTFVINRHGVFGEIIRGSLSQLSQGFYEEADQPPIRFWGDLKGKIVTEPKDPDAAKHIETVLAWLAIEPASLRDEIAAEMNAQFTHGYLNGYFETTDSPEFGLWFGDYNRVLGDMYADFKPEHPPVASGSVKNDAALVVGQVGSAGTATGVVRIVESPEDGDFTPGEILVCKMTTPAYVRLMQQAAAIVTDQGGILSHAAIVARELGKPCITGTQRATAVLQTGQRVIVDGHSGEVRSAG